MKRSTKAVIAGVAVVAAIGAGSSVAFAGGSDDDATDTPIASPDLEKASAAALAHTGGGKVTETEINDEESYYEVEVTLDDGRQVDVQLDEDFAVVGEKTERGEKD
ncbi:MAG TPA: PepSY domain-containing protein [Acidimicrobiales bacterium]|nr:PepSY domain-containing protein [Acidimicrobiales bacterium]